MSGGETPPAPSAPPPAPGAPPPPPLHRDGLSRPETTLEKIGFAASKWLGRAGIAVVLLALVFGVVVLVPLWKIAGSPSYVAAQSFVARNDDALTELGGEIAGFDLVPTRYRVGADRAEYVFGVQGAIVHGIAHVTVERQDGVWSVTSASFVTDLRQRGVHRPLVLKAGKER